MNVATIGRNGLRTTSLNRIFDSLGLYRERPREEGYLVPYLGATVETGQLSADQIGRAVIARRHKRPIMDIKSRWSRLASQACRFSITAVQRRLHPWLGGPRFAGPLNLSALKGEDS